MAAAGAEEVSRLDLFGARDDPGLVVLAPLSDLAVTKPELSQATDEPGGHFLEMKRVGTVRHPKGLWRCMRERR